MHSVEASKNFNLFLLQKISLTQFKNYDCRQFSFEKKIVGITGANGVGKTNLLEAIHYLCFTKSYFNAADIQNIRHDTNGFRIEGVFLKKDQEEKISCVLKEGNKKEVKRNDIAYTKFSQHIGLFPAVMIAPDDAEIIMDGSEQRRRWLDALLCQLNIHYLDHLIAYQKILQQRNSLLKSIADRHKADHNLIDALDIQLSPHASAIFEERKKFITAFFPEVQQRYDIIAGNHESVEIQYQSQLQDQDYEALLFSNREKDILLQRTTAGIHRDELLFLLNDYLIKITGSQGQRKSFLFALKLAQYFILQQHKHIAPLLLLDDIFEKLDARRIARLVQLISSENFGQVFITDTDASRLGQIFADKLDQLQLIAIE